MFLLRLHVLVKTTLRQGSEWVLAKKSEKCVMSSLLGGSMWIGQRFVKGVGKWFLAGGVWGCSPRKFLDSRAACGAFQCFFGSFYPNTHTPTPY